MASNTNIQIADLDFDRIKSSLKTYLKSQSTFQDYDFEGSALSTLIDVLAYNTHYQAYYLNMLANEMFLDTAQLRSSAISHAKMLNYTPTSASAPYAEVNLVVNNVTNASSVTIPKFTKFQSEAVDGVNYTYVTYDSKTVNVSSNTATFTNLGIYQGEPVSYQFFVDDSVNQSQTFTLPDANIDTSTITVTIQQNSSNTSITTFTKSVDYLALTGASKVFFLQEGLDGYYEIYFGDGVIGQKLSYGNIVNVSYVVTQASSSRGANNFVLLDNIGYANTITYPVIASSAGSDRESIDSIRFTAPKVYAAQNRAVTKDDYVALVKKASTEYPIDAVTVWGGDEEERPVYGKVYIAIKPTGKYLFTATEKKHIVDEVIKPMNVLTVTPVVVDPDYTYLNIVCDVEYDPKLTTKSSEDIKNTVISAIQAYSATTLNTFNASFSLPNMLKYVSDSDASITSENIEVTLEKRFTPSVLVSQSQTFKFGTALRIGTSGHSVSIKPSYQVTANVQSIVTQIDDAFLEEKLDPTQTTLSTGAVQSYYYNNGQKIIISETAGTINYANGDVVLTSFAPSAINNEFGTMKIYAVPESHIIKSTKNRILTLDDTDSTSVVVNVTVKQ
jgi:hypothetical protein